jgi:hypothetical protein
MAASQGELESGSVARADLASAVPSAISPSLVDICVSLALTVPPTGHVGPVPVGGLIQH